MLKIEYTHEIDTTIIYCDNDGITFKHDASSTINELVEYACSNIQIHDFVSADICDRDTGEVLVIITRD